MADLSKAKQYCDRVYDEIIKRDPDQPEFHNTCKEILTTIVPLIAEHPEYEDAALLERFFEAERTIIFRVPWEDDNNKLRVNRGFRIQMSSAIGPFKGGLRFHPSVNLSILKFLGTEQILKNALSGLPIGGAKGGSDFDPKGKSDHEVMRFCQSFMLELFHHIGPDIDVPAGDIGVGGREIGYLYGQFKRISKTTQAGVLTGKGISYGGSLVRTEATGYGLLYYVDCMLKDAGKSLEGKTVLVSGSGNVAIYALEKAWQLGAKPITCSDSNGYVVDKDGIDVALVKQIKEVERGRIKEYAVRKPTAEYHEGCKGVWTVKGDIALPCATQNELDIDGAKALVANGVIAVGEGANMPTTLEAIAYLQGNGVFFAPAKAANLGGVSVSALEMAQNSARLPWTFEEVDARLKRIMADSFQKSKECAAHYGEPGNLLLGANIAGFAKVANAMYLQGIV